MRMAKYKAATLACLDASSWALFLALPASRSFTYMSQKTLCSHNHCGAWLTQNMVKKRRNNNALLIWILLLTIITTLIMNISTVILIIIMKTYKLRLSSS